VATLLGAVVQSAYLAWRTKPTGGASGLYSGTPSELVAGDFIYGSRMVVTGTPTLSGSNYVVPVSRLNATGTVSWPSSQTIYFVR
jgi:hypothetical protein